MRNTFRLRENLISRTSEILPQNRVVVNTYKRELQELIECLRSLSQEWQNYLDMRERVTEPASFRVSVDSRSSRGRPRFHELLEYLHALSFSWESIASLFGVSRMTVYRRRQEFGMLAEPSRSLDDDDLKTVLTQMRRELPKLGERMVVGRLRSLGYDITRARVREAVRSTDPINTALRWQGGLTPRRPYSVPGPNSLWHIGK